MSDSSFQNHCPGLSRSCSTLSYVAAMSCAMVTPTTRLGGIRKNVFFPGTHRASSGSSTNPAALIPPSCRNLRLFTIHPSFLPNRDDPLDGIRHLFPLWPTLTNPVGDEPDAEVFPLFGILAPRFAKSLRSSTQHRSQMCCEQCTQCRGFSIRKLNKQCGH